MKPIRSRTSVALCALLLTASLSVVGCSPATDADNGSSGDATEAPATDTGGDSVACPAEMDDLASAGGSFDFVRVEPADYVVPGIDAALHEAACRYEFTTDGKVAQWAWFPGEDAAAVDASLTAALTAAGYTLSDEFDGFRQFSAASAPNITVAVIGTAEDAGAAGAEVFDLLGPYVSLFQDFS
ncbi:MAG: hypothetical protein ABI566_00910 [Pseudolysinimonas sp.]